MKRFLFAFPFIHRLSPELVGRVVVELDRQVGRVFQHQCADVIHVVGREDNRFLPVAEPVFEIVGAHLRPLHFKEGGVLAIGSFEIGAVCLCFCDDLVSCCRRVISFSFIFPFVLEFD